MSRKISRHIPLLCALAFASAALAADPADDDPYVDRIPGASLETLCTLRFRPALTARADAEIARRKLLTPAQMAAVKSKKIRLGMTSKLVRCIYGAPVDVNTTVTGSGAREQWVYGEGEYLYFTNGVLTAAQY